MYKEVRKEPRPSELTIGLLVHQTVCLGRRAPEKEKHESHNLSDGSLPNVSPDAPGKALPTWPLHFDIVR